MTCRCGRQTATSHPCHHGGYACTNEGTERFYAKPIGSFSVAGAQMKLVASQTIACDEHWAEFNGPYPKVSTDE